MTLGPYAALGWRFTVDAPDPAVRAEAAHALSTLQTTGPTAGTPGYLLQPAAADRAARLLLDGELVLEATGPAALLASLLWHVNLAAADATTDHVLLHAAAAERDGRAVLLCAPEESGKTTLVAGLVRAGLRYLTDETVALRPSDGGITPYPKALSVDEGSWPVLPDLRPAGLLPGSRQWQVVPTDLRPDAVSPRATPAVVVLPRYRPGAATTLERVTPGTAMLEVLQQTFRLERDRARDMAVVARTLERCPCYRLVSGDLDEAVAAVLGTLR